MSMLAIALTGCGSNGSDGAAGPPGAPGAPGTGVTVTPASTTALNMTITGASVSSPPVVNFTVTNENNVPVAGLVDANLRLNIAKLVPGTNGAPSNWQNYINRASSGAVQGSQERNATGYNWGTLVDHKDGTYTYTFKTDITSAAANPCPAPCTDADGKALDISYQPTLTHRISIQVTAPSGTTLPKSNAVYDFVPAGGAVTTTRDIITTAKCNECHSQLSAHGTRIETKLCVTCHNPGSWVAGTPNTPVDFKVMIHKIHRGESLPSVVGPDGVLHTPDDGTYKVNNTDFSDVVFPQDIRNCTKCHDGAVTAQGDNWETQPSTKACGSCHDDIDFSKSAPPSGTDPNGHPGGDVSTITDSSQCLFCHKTGGVAQSIAARHSLPSLLKAEAAKYVLKIVSVTNATPGLAPIVKFQITNASGTLYHIETTPAITGGSMSLIIGWDTTDMKNTTPTVGRSNAQPISISLLSSGALVAGVSNTADTYTIQSGTVIPADATGIGRAGFYARMSVDVDGDGTNDTIQAKSVVKDFIITGSSVVARRTVVDIAKCDQCHERLSLHGGARTDEPQLCVMCHNPNATDTARRPVGAPAGTLDNKKEESIDFKRMIHGIHAAGMRVNGLVVYGFFSAPATENPVDFRDVRFPGILNNCTACHTTSSYQLSGVWVSPTQSGILGSTIDHGASLTDPADDLNISPTAGACSSCHDDALSQTHMTQVGGAAFAALESTINTNLETCSICHGPGNIADVKTVHGVK
jgi:OmcA/MtrC family decaheme c-type cytochrome